MDVTSPHFYHIWSNSFSKTYIQSFVIGPLIVTSNEETFYRQFLELLKNCEVIFSHYYLHSDGCSLFNLATHLVYIIPV